MIRIYQTEGKALVSARELHQVLQVSSEFEPWFKNRIEKYGLLDNFDYWPLSKSLENALQDPDYALSLARAKDLALVENSSLGKAVRLYLNQYQRKMLVPAVRDHPAYPKELVQEVTQHRQFLHQLATRTTKIENQLQITTEQYYTILGYAKLRNKIISFKQAIVLGKRATELSHKLQCPINKVKDPRFGAVNAYALLVLRQVIF